MEERAAKRLLESELKVLPSRERRSEYRRASFGQLCLHSIKKVSDSITQVWGLLTPNIWILDGPKDARMLCFPPGSLPSAQPRAAWGEGAPGQPPHFLQGALGHLPADRTHVGGGEAETVQPVCSGAALHPPLGADNPVPSAQLRVLAFLMGP